MDEEVLQEEAEDPEHINTVSYGLNGRDNLTSENRVDHVSKEALYCIRKE